jgi:hypothetical protein
MTNVHYQARPAAMRRPLVFWAVLGLALPLYQLASA